MRVQISTASGSERASR